VASPRRCTAWRSILILAAVASWNFPWGVVVDVGIITAYILVKRKKVPAGAKAVKAAPGQTTAGDDSIKLLAMAMLSDRVNASGNAAATSLGLPPAPAPRKAGRSTSTMDAADRAERLRLLE
jgi:hypothetical protein